MTTSRSNRASCRKTIEIAQSRVEGFNFDIRKRVVEFDDVINKQRETIYAERDKVLHNEDLTETVQAFLDDEVDALVETHLVGEDPDDWNLDALSGGARRDGSDRRRHLGRRALGARTRDAISTTSASSPTTAGGEGSRGRRGGLGDGRAARPHPDDRLALGRAPDRARRHAPGHRPPGLRPAGPAQRVQSRGVPALRRAARPDPPRRRVVDLPGHGQPPARPSGGDPAVAASLARGAALGGGNGSTARVARTGDGRIERGPSRVPRLPSGHGPRGSGGVERRPCGRADGEADARIARRRGRLGGRAAPAPGERRPRPASPRRGARIGRNDPCWCGSGAKYKKCHGR